VKIVLIVYLQNRLCFFPIFIWYRPAFVYFKLYRYAVLQFYIICKITVHCDRRKTHIIITCPFNTMSIVIIIVWNFVHFIFLKDVHTSFTVQTRISSLQGTTKKAHLPWKWNSVVCFEVSRTICGRVTADKIISGSAFLRPWLKF